MQGVQAQAVSELFEAARAKGERDGVHVAFSVSYYEIYGGKLYDLLNNHERLNVCEDKSGAVQIQGLREVDVQDEQTLLECIEYGASVRMTQATASNDVSSRSHAICTISMREMRAGPGGKWVFEQGGKLLLVDLAGSERAADCQSNDKARRAEGAEINKSLLALKECLRAFEANKGGAGAHVPFRSAKLTLVLRDSFINRGSGVRVVMVCCVSPGKSSADHTLNSLRYAQHLKDAPALRKNSSDLGFLRG